MSYIYKLFLSCVIIGGLFLALPNPALAVEQRIYPPENANSADLTANGAYKLTWVTQARPVQCHTHDDGTQECHGQGDETVPTKTGGGSGPGDADGTLAGQIFKIPDNIRKLTKINVDEIEFAGAGVDPVVFGPDPNGTRINKPMTVGIFRWATQPRYCGAEHPVDGIGNVNACYLSDNGFCTSSNGCDKQYADIRKGELVWSTRFNTPPNVANSDVIFDGAKFEIRNINLTVTPGEQYYIEIMWLKNDGERTMRLNTNITNPYPDGYMTYPQGCISNVDAGLQGRRVWRYREDFADEGRLTVRTQFAWMRYNYADRNACEYGQCSCGETGAGQYGNRVKVTYQDQLNRPITQNETQGDIGSDLADLRIYGQPGIEGYFDSASCTDMKAYGWACDNNNPAETAKINLYKDGPSGSGTLIAQDKPADKANNPGELLCGVSTAHRFVIDIPASFKDNVQHQIYAYGSSSSEPSKIPLTNSPKTVQCAPDCPKAPGCLASTPTTPMACTTNSVTLKWKAAQYATRYNLRVDDGQTGQNASIPGVANNCGGGHDICVNDLPATTYCQGSDCSVAINVTPGATRSYSWWIHASNEFCPGSALASANFALSCGTTTIPVLTTLYAGAGAGATYEGQTGTTATYKNSGLRSDQSGSNYYNELIISQVISDPDNTASLIGAAFIKKGDNPKTLSALATSAQAVEVNGFVLVYAKKPDMVDGKTLATGKHYISFGTDRWKEIESYPLEVYTYPSGCNINTTKGPITCQIKAIVKPDIGGNINKPEEFEVTFYKDMGSHTWDTYGYLKTQDAVEVAQKKDPVPFPNASRSRASSLAGACE